MPANENHSVCPFCKPDINEAAFLDSEKFIAVYNIAPVFPGHSLVIPRKHITSLLEFSDQELFEFVKFSRKAIIVLSEAFSTEGFNWILQEREEAGQSIAHMHIHILPRKPGDLKHPGDWYPKMKHYTDNNIESDKRMNLKPAEIKKIVAKLRSTAKKLF